MFAIVTDSTVYLSKTQAKDWGVHIVEMTYTDSKKIYTESFSDHNGSFEKFINNGKWSTSQPSIDAYKAKFEELIKKYDNILCLIMSSRLSGAYSSALLAAKEVNETKIKVFDSLSTSSGLKLQVKRAVELNEQGANIDDVFNILETEKSKIRCIFSVDDMEPLRKSGRIGVVRQAISTILNIRPILMLEDGAIVTSQMSKGKQDQIKRLISSVHINAKEIDVAYFGSPDSAVKLMSGLTEKFTNAKITVSSVGPVLGIHLGLTAIGVAYRDLE